MPTTGSPAATLKPAAIGLLDALVIGLASTSPAYSLAAVIGPIVVLVGVSAPGVLLASFVPMLLIAAAFQHLNAVDPDCGTTFSWVTRAMGPWWGWCGGWAIAMTGVLVIGSLAETGVRFSLLTLGADAAADDTWLVRGLAVLLVVVMTGVCVRGTELSARLQSVLIVAQLGALLAFAVVALARVAAGTSSLDPVTPSLRWLDPFAEGGTALSGGLLLGVFAYWGWESSVNLTEETSSPRRAPGRAAVAATVVLLGVYVAVAYAVVAYAGTSYLAANAGQEEAVLALLATEVMGSWDWVVLLAVATSAVAATQTTIIPASRTGLSMARRHALPPGLARIHPRHRTPDVSTWWVAGIAIGWYVLVSAISENALLDSVSALSLLIAFYYALTGIACAIVFRHRLTESVRSLLLVGVGPVLGALMLLMLLVRAAVDLADPATSYSGRAWLGLGPPLVIAVGISLAGVVVVLVWRARDRSFWRETHGTVAPRGE